MLKRFFISMLGTIAGLWISIILLVVVSIIGIGVIVGKAIGETSAPTFKEGILYIPLNGYIDEYEADLSIFDIVSGNEYQTLANITTAVRMAAKDKKIKGIYLDCTGGETGFASREEILDALTEFKDSGKWIYAYSDNYDQGDYYLASIADKIYLNPVGSVDVRGIASTTIFFKNLLDKVGVEMQVLRVGQFKSAVEPFMRTDMSEASEMQTSIFVNQIWYNVRTAIGSNRNVGGKNVNMWADSLAFTWDPDLYLKHKVVTDLAYRSDFENKLRDKAGVKKDGDLPLITPSEYLSNNSGKLCSASKPHVAVLYAVGDIVDTGDQGISAEVMVPQILDLAKDDNVKGLVLRVNSGGGSAFASEQIWHALEDFKATGKPFFVSMGDYAASGGYYISCGADKIYADANTLTGSIGIFGLIPNAEKLLVDKIGVNFQTVESNPGANFPAVYQPMTEQQANAMQSYINRGYETFTSRVAEGRGLPQDSVKAIGGGRVWDGLSAINIGLVDATGTLDAAVNFMTSQLDLDPGSYVNYPELETSLKAMLASGLPAGLSLSAEALPVDGFTPYIHAMRQTTSLNPVQARMEPVILK